VSTTVQTFKFSKALNRIRYHIQLPRKFKVVIKLNSTLPRHNTHNSARMMVKKTQKRKS